MINVWLVFLNLILVLGSKPLSVHTSYELTVVLLSDPSKWWCVSLLVFMAETSSAPLKPIISCPNAILHMLPLPFSMPGRQLLNSVPVFSFVWRMTRSKEFMIRLNNVRWSVKLLVELVWTSTVFVQQGIVYYDYWSFIVWWVLQILHCWYQRLFKWDCANAAGIWCYCPLCRSRRQ